MEYCISTMDIEFLKGITVRHEKEQKPRQNKEGELLAFLFLRGGLTSRRCGLTIILHFAIH